MSAVISSADRRLLLAQLGKPWCDVDYQFTRLPSESNRNYLLQAKGRESIVLRVPQADEQILGVDRAQEQEVCQWAGQVEISPRLLWACAESGMMLSEYYPVQTVDNAGEGFVTALSQKLSTLHLSSHKQSKLQVKPRCILAHISSYEKTLHERGFVPSSLVEHGDVELAIKFALKLWPQFAQTFRLCHCDLSRDNILYGQAGIRFVDWEYVALTSPILDIANVIQSYNWQPPVVDLFLQHYPYQEVLGASFAEAFVIATSTSQRQAFSVALSVARFLLAWQSFYWAVLHYQQAPILNSYRQSLIDETQLLLSLEASLRH